MSELTPHPLGHLETAARNQIFYQLSSHWNCFLPMLFWGGIEHLRRKLCRRTNPQRHL